MCILTFLPAGIQPDREALWNGALTNPDGHGYAIVVDDQIIIGKDMDPTVAIDKFMEARAEFPDGPALFHSRIATAGVVNAFNIHPFHVGGDKRTVIAHNGIMPKAVQPGKKNPASDTRIVAEKFLPQFGSLRHRSNRLKFEKWMGTWNKVVLLTVDPRFREQAYILNEKSGTWDDGRWYSNDGYLPYTPKKWASFGAHYWEGVDATGVGKVTATEWVDTCGQCGAITDYTESGYCGMCGWCLDCGEMGEYCQCYTPDHMRSAGGTGTYPPSTPGIVWPKVDGTDIKLATVIGPRVADAIHD